MDNTYTSWNHEKLKFSYSVEIWNYNTHLEIRDDSERDIRCQKEHVHSCRF